jgi:hypothetical protein
VSDHVVHIILVVLRPGVVPCVLVILRVVVVIVVGLRVIHHVVVLVIRKIATPALVQPTASRGQVERGTLRGRDELRCGGSPPFCGLRLLLGGALVAGPPPLLVLALQRAEFFELLLAAVQPALPDRRLAHTAFKIHDALLGGGERRLGARRLLGLLVVGLDGDGLVLGEPLLLLLGRLH